MMNTIRGTIRNGQIVPEEPFDWPEGSHVVIGAVLNDRRPISRGMTEDEQGDSPEEVERWIREYDAIGALVLTPDEEAELMAFQKEAKEYNREAVRWQMEKGIVE